MTISSHNLSPRLPNSEGRRFHFFSTPSWTGNQIFHWSSLYSLLCILDCIHQRHWTLSFLAKTFFEYNFILWTIFNYGSGIIYSKFISIFSLVLMKKSDDEIVVNKFRNTPPPPLLWNGGREGNVNKEIMVVKRRVRRQNGWLGMQSNEIAIWNRLLGQFLPRILS